MSFSKTEIYNIALSECLLSRQIEDAATDTSNEVKNLNRFWNIALTSTLRDLDLDSLATPVVLELLVQLDSTSNYPWTYVYKYPQNCAFFRRLSTDFIVDTKQTHIPKRVAIYEGQKAIFTDEQDAIGDIIPDDIGLKDLGPMAGMAVGQKLAMLSSPLLVGKGAKTLRKEIEQRYLISKAEAQESDMRENFNYESEATRSEFVQERLS